MGRARRLHEVYPPVSALANGRPSTVSLSIEQHGDVRRLRMVSMAGRGVRIDVSAYVFRGVMVDTGFHRARRALVAAADAAGVRGVIVTHWHEDHAGNVARLARRGMPMIIGAETERMLRERPEIQLYRRAIWGRPPALEHPVKAFESEEFELVPTPGHSEDHQIVWHPETNTIFSGDLWLGVRTRTFHRAEDPYRVVGSLRLAAALCPERMFDAHRGLVETPTVALLARAEWLASMLEEIARRVAAGEEEDQILSEALGGEELAGFISRGEYSRRNLVRAVRRRLTRAS